MLFCFILCFSTVHTTGLFCSPLAQSPSMEGEGGEWQTIWKFGGLERHFSAVCLEFLLVNKNVIDIQMFVFL
jgi:hypothetical protein